MAKAAKSVSIIGGADGPTSVFIVGKSHKEKNVIRRMKHCIQNNHYQRKRRQAERNIVPNAHTLGETVQYMKDVYGAVEVDRSYLDYRERKNQAKCALVQKEAPELLGEQQRILPPDDLEDIHAVQEWLEKIDAWNADCEKKAEGLSEEAFPFDYHLYVIDKTESGRIEIETESLHGLFAVSYSAHSGRKNRKRMDSIVKDIYLYYGVTKQDIKDRSERYQMLVTELAT